jgi:hypothetical protein
VLGDLALQAHASDGPSDHTSQIYLPFASKDPLEVYTNQA